MPQATQVQFSPSGQSSDQPTPNYQDKAETPESREILPQQPDKGKIPRLQSVVESKAFRNILVDEVDMMQSRAATLIQVSWRRHKLRQKLLSQMLTAKGVQAAWRRFKTRRRLGAEKKMSVDEENIPYHPPQQVRFHPSEEDRYLPVPPVMVNKETQFPSDDSLAACAHELALLQPAGVPPPGMPAPCATGGPSVTFVPIQTVSVRLPCPVSPSAKYHPCLLTRTIRSTSLLHLEGDMTKTKPATARASKAGALGPPCERIAQTLHGPPKAQTQAHVEAEVLRAPPQTGQPVSTQVTPLKSCLASMMNKSTPQPGPTPTVIKAKTPPQPDSAVPVAQTTLQSCLAAPVTKTPAQIRPTVLVTSAAPQTQPAAVTSIFKPPTQTCPIPVTAKTLPQVHPTATMSTSLLQTCPVATTAKTPSQMLPGASTTKIPTQTRLAAMITKTPAQLRSVATVLRNLCLPPPADGNLKASPPAVVEDGIPNASSQTNLNRPNAKAVVSGSQVAGTVKVSSHSHLTEGKVKYWPPAHLGAGAPKAPARPFSEAEKIRSFSQKQVRIATMSNTSVAEDRSKVLSQARLKTDVMKVQSQVGVPIEMAVVLPQAHLGTCPAKPLPRAQKATCSTTASPQRHMLAKQTRATPQANIVRCLSKPPSQAHPPAKLTMAPSLPPPGTCLTKTQSRAHLTTEVIKVQSQAHLPARLTKAQSQAQLVTETAKCLYAAHQAAELSSKTRSQPLLDGFKTSTQPHPHAGSLGTLSRAKPEDRRTQLPAHSCAQGKATEGPGQGASKTPNMLVPLLASTGPPACNVESWGDSRATLAPPLATSPAAPCPEELGAAQLASLCAELATVLGSQEDIRALLAKALPQGEVRAALNQALSKEILGTTMAKALPQGMLGTALVKALSWGELGTALSCALSRGELQAELTKAIQGRLVDVLCKVLTEEDRAALSQAVCQGELGTVLSQSLSQAALLTGLVLPKATSKTLGSGMIVTPVPVEVDSRESRSTAWGPTMGRVRPQLSKVRVPQGGAWEGVVTGGPAGLLEDMGGGPVVRRSPCLSGAYVGASLVTRLITTILHFPLIAVLDPTLSWGEGDSSVHAGVGKSASDLHSG